MTSGFSGDLPPGTTGKHIDEDAACYGTVRIGYCRSPHCSQPLSPKSEYLCEHHLAQQKPPVGGR